MGEFVLRELKNIDYDKELEAIGFDSSYRFRAVEKLDSRLIKVYNLSPAQANIIKQTAISIGADCMTHREVITGNVDQSDVIITANTAELKKISQKLLCQPFKLKLLAEQLLNHCNKKEKIKTKLVGVLNITEDSFSDGGEFLELDLAKKQFMKLVEDGADMIDIGAESTRPRSNPVDAKTQLSRLLPILEFALGEGIQLPISVDTRSAKVAKEVLKLGEFIINDVSGLKYDKSMLDVLAERNAGVIIQHSIATPDVMQDAPVEGDVMERIVFDLREQVALARKNGVKNIIVDPGVGFGKTREQCLEILRRFEELEILGCPIMLGLSRKSFLNMPTASNEEKDIMSLALSAPLIERGVEYLRVHNIKPYREYIKIIS